MDSFKLGHLKLEDNEHLIVGDPCYFDDTPDGYHTLELGWQAGEFPVFLITDGGSPTALVLSRTPFAPSLLELQHAFAHTILGVDSGQMAMIAADILPTWTESDQRDFNAPGCDYDYACVATLQSQLGADFLGGRLVKASDDHPSKQVGTAVASGTRYGDGEYPLMLIRDDGEITAVAVLFDWMNDDGDEDFDEEWDEETEPDVDELEAVS